MRKVLRTRRHESLRGVASPRLSDSAAQRAFPAISPRLLSLCLDSPCGTVVHRPRGAREGNPADVPLAKPWLRAETLFPGAVLEREQVSPDTDGALRADVSVHPAERAVRICIRRAGARANDRADAQGGIRDRSWKG